MRIYLLNILLICSITVLSCNTYNKTIKTDKKAGNRSSSKKFKVDGLTVSPKQSTEFDTLIKFNSDTLAIQVFSKYVYFPFGIIKAEFKPQLGLLQNFSLIIDTLSTDIGDTYLQVLQHNTNKIVFSFNSTYKGSESDLFSGEIHDSDVNFVNGIKIGMSVEDFYAIFFDNFPVKLMNRYKYFSLMSIDGIEHIYFFADNKLKSIKFTRGVYWKLTYNHLSQ